ncbi:MAG TPA: DUF4097 family beta strand repeat-containing protein [Terriglobales bacterium]|nr:DUF4097 family beta strand repeat-containing protein [Terriglobales bacterium]
MNYRRLLGPAALLTLLFSASLPALADEATGQFERTLQVTGPVDLSVETGSGDITVRPGTAGTVQIRARIHARSKLFESLTATEKVQRIQANPPIDQVGNIIRIGKIRDEDLRQNVSISYEVVTPATSKLRSSTGSGDQSVEGVEGPVRASTGSGNVRISSIRQEVFAESGSGDLDLNSLAGGLRANTGSGNIRAFAITGRTSAQTGSGDVTLELTESSEVRVQTGSGNARIRGVRGALAAETGSGEIEAEGVPTAPWKLTAGSGDITLHIPESSGFELYAETGSGTVRIGRPITMQGALRRDLVRGTVGGGGSLIRLETGSGNIDIR